jgi:hypothetical protein
VPLTKQRNKNRMQAPCNLESMHDYDFMRVRETIPGGPRSSRGTVGIESIDMLNVYHDYSTNLESSREFH